MFNYYTGTALFVLATPPFANSASVTPVRLNLYLNGVELSMVTLALPAVVLSVWGNHDYPDKSA